ncbi:hypothetical protein RI367_001348 [Sorochytrium milnesiophthora]
MGIFSRKDSTKDKDKSGKRSRSASSPALPNQQADNDDEAVKTPATIAAIERTVAPKPRLETEDNQPTRQRKDSEKKKEQVIDLPPVKKTTPLPEVDLVKRPRTRCCCLFHMPTSIVLMIVLLLGNDMWFAWYSMNQANQASQLYADMKTTWQQQGAVAVLQRAKDVQTIFNANVIVACIDMVFTLLGLAGVDTENFFCFLISTIWKVLQFGYSVSSSIVTITFVQYYQGSLQASQMKDLVTWETGWSFAGLILELYFLILMIVYLHYLRRLRGVRKQAKRDVMDE